MGGGEVLSKSLISILGGREFRAGIGGAKKVIPSIGGRQQKEVLLKSLIFILGKKVFEMALDEQTNKGHPKHRGGGNVLLKSLIFTQG